MLRYLLTDDDMGGVRFAISPLCELGLSLRAITDPARFPLQLGWLRRTEVARRDLDFTVLNALIDARGWTPDFINPRPDAPMMRLDDELATLRGIDPDVFRGDLVAVHGEVPRVLRGSVDAALTRVEIALRQLWETCIEPYWPRMRTVLEADIVHRGRTIAQSGLTTMLNGLTERVSYRPGVLEVRLTDPNSRDRIVGGEGLTLMPTMFTRRGSAPVGDGPPMVLYPARGQGALWTPQRAPGDDALAAVIGRTRTEMLQMLGEPASSTELAVRLGVTTSAANQHLRALRSAGMLSSVRYGRSVLYLRSEVGDALMGAD